MSAFFSSIAGKIIGVLISLGILASIGSPASPISTSTPGEVTIPVTTTILGTPPVSSATTQGSSVPSGTSTVLPVVKKDVLNLKTLPLGDYDVTTAPKQGNIYSCQTVFAANQAGAQTNGSWIHGSTWDLTEKLQVEGAVHWPNALFTISTSGGNRMVTGNGLPVDSLTGIFPIQSSDPAYQVDRNPNSIQTQTISLSLPLNPTLASAPRCVNMGMIGIAFNGVPIFNGLDAGGRDAVAHEVQDVCSGHPQQEGMYHYHGPSSCMPHESDVNTLVGYALDGFGIYSIYGADGKEVTDADLDACHGTTSPVVFNGVKSAMYHYVLTREYPYTIGCYRGTPVTTSGAGGGGTSGTNSTTQNSQPPTQTSSGSGQPTPPQAAIDACSGKSTGTYCSVGPNYGSCQTRAGVLACIPN